MKYWARTKALGVWLWEAKIAWFTLAVIGVALLVCGIGGATEERVTYVGLALELLGLGSAAFGIGETLKLFHMDGMLSWVRKWIKRFPLFRKRIIAPITGSAAANSTAAGRLRGWVSAPPNPTVAQQISALNQNVKLLQARCDEIERETEKRFDLQERLIRQEEIVRRKDVQEMRALLTETQTGGLGTAVMGTVWLFFGLVMTTIPDDVARWINYLS